MAQNHKAIRTLGLSMNNSAIMWYTWGNNQSWRPVSKDYFQFLGNKDHLLYYIK